MKAPMLCMQMIEFDQVNSILTMVLTFGFLEYFHTFRDITQLAKATSRPACHAMRTVSSIGEL